MGLPPAEPEPARGRRDSRRLPCGGTGSTAPGSAILASFVASGRLKYSRVTTGPATTISPMVPSGTSRSSDQTGIGSSRMTMIRASIPSTGRPTQTPLPASVDRRVSPRISSLPIVATGSDFGRPVGREELSRRFEPAGHPLDDGRRKPAHPPRRPASAIGSFASDPASSRDELPEQGRRAEQIGRAEVFDRLDDLRRIGPGGSGRVHVGHDRRHPQGGGEEREERERAEVDLARLDREDIADLLHLRVEDALGIDAPFGGPVLPLVNRIAAGSSASDGSASECRAFRPAAIASRPARRRSSRVFRPDSTRTRAGPGATRMT